jgi:hypothetical protein
VATVVTSDSGQPVRVTTSRRTWLPPCDRAALPSQRNANRAAARPLNSTPVTLVSCGRESSLVADAGRCRLEARDGRTDRIRPVQCPVRFRRRTRSGLRSQSATCANCREGKGRARGLPALRDDRDHCSCARGTVARMRVGFSATNFAAREGHSRYVDGFVPRMRISCEAAAVGFTRDGRRTGGWAVTVSAVAERWQMLVRSVGSQRSQCLLEFGVVGSEAPWLCASGAKSFST